MVVEYDNKTLMPSIVVAFKIPNPSIVGCTKPPTFFDDESILGGMTPNETTLHGLLKYEFKKFNHLCVKPKDCLLP